jgi:hypothetical protein
VRGDERYMWPEFTCIKESAICSHFFEKAHTLFEQSSDLAGVSDALACAGLACIRLEGLDDALSYYVRMRSVVILREDMSGVSWALHVTSNCSEVLRALGHDDEALKGFESAEYVAFTLSDPERLLQIHIRLGKLYWNQDKPEFSIAYRLKVCRRLQETDEPTTASQFRFLVAHTYELKLGRIEDACFYYRQAVGLGDSTDNENRTLFSERLAMCEKQLAQTPRAPSLYGLVCEATVSDAEAEGVGVRMALALDYNLWCFELRSFCAWFERVFRQIADANNIPS